MPRLFVTLACCLGAAALAGCVSVRDMNPFVAHPLRSGEVAYGRFPHIPLPKELTPIRRSGFADYGSDGAPSGLETLEGNVDLAELARAMISYMERDGWTLRMALSGADRGIQVYERQDSRAVLHYRRRLAVTVMEVWAGDRPGDGVRPPGAAAPSARGGGQLRERDLP